MIKEKKSFSLERLWENFIWATRFMVIIAIVAGLAASLMLFILGGWDILKAFQVFLGVFSDHGNPKDEIIILGLVIGAVDTFLIAVVLLLFNFGLYELFISKIDPARSNGEVTILKSTSLDVLKDKIASVIIMALIVKFFQIVLTIDAQSFTEIILFAGSVTLLALAVLALQLGKKILSEEKGKCEEET